MKKIIQILGYVLGVIITERLSGYYSAVVNNLYTGYCRSRLKSIGKNSVICRPVKIIGAMYIVIADDVYVGRSGCLTAWDNGSNSLKRPEIKIGNNVTIGEEFHITCSNSISVGNDVLFGKKVTITDNSHGRCDDINDLYLAPLRRETYSKGPVVINDRVWIGDKATILPGITIGEGAIVGANSVVTSDVPDYCIVAGAPAKIIRYFQ